MILSSWSIVVSDPMLQQHITSWIICARKEVMLLAYSFFFFLYHLYVVVDSIIIVLVYGLRFVFRWTAIIHHRPIFLK